MPRLSRYWPEMTSSAPSLTLGFSVFKSRDQFIQAKLDYGSVGEGVNRWIDPIAGLPFEIRGGEIFTEWGREGLKFIHLRTSFYEVLDQTWNVR